MLVMDTGHTVKSVYKGPSREPENVSFIISCPSYTYALFINWENETALYRQ